MRLIEYQAMIQRWAEKEQAAALIKLNDYAGDPDVLGLLKATAVRRGVSVWDVWQDWAWRHVIPIEEIISQMSVPDCMPAERRRKILGWRLADVLGYVFLGLAMLEEEEATAEICSRIVAKFPV